MAHLRSYNLVVAVDSGLFADTILPLIKNVAPLFDSVDVHTSDREAPWITEKLKKCVLLCSGSAGRAAIELLCANDAALPLQQRRVQWIHSLTAGMDSYDLPTTKHIIGSIPFSNARGIYATDLAEHVLLAMMYFNRSVARWQMNHKNKVYDRFSHSSLSAATVGIVGYGDIGRRTAQVLRPFGCRVLGLRRSAPKETYDDHGVEVLHGEGGLSRLLRESDFIVNIMPATADNYHMFNATLFKQMKPTSVYINIGRGRTQVEQDIADAINTGMIKGAAVDVFETEPLPELSPLWSVDTSKLLLTPHSADIVEGWEHDAMNQFTDLASNFVERGRLPDYLIDTQGKGY